MNWKLQLWKLTLDVTHMDLMRGKPNSPCFCPIALALKRKFRWGWPEVAGKQIRVYGWLGYYEFRMTAPIEIFMGHFDGHGMMGVCARPFDLIGVWKWNPIAWVRRIRSAK